MRRVSVLAVIGALQVGLLAGLARAGALDFADEVDAFDETRWAEGDHRLGRSYLDPANVSVGESNLKIKLPARTLNGGGIRSHDLYGYGMYAIRMRVPNAPSSITGFFLYEPPDYASEIDIEVYNDSSRRILFSTYAGGAQTHTQTLTLPFDPTAGFHEYRFGYSSGSVRFYADGVLMKEWTGPSDDRDETLRERLVPRLARRPQGQQGQVLAGRRDPTHQPVNPNTVEVGHTAHRSSPGAPPLSG